MAIHDTWHFENAPQGVNLALAAYTTPYNTNTIYNQYTGNTGQPQSVGSSQTLVSSDGFLTFPSTSAGAGGILFAQLSAVQDWSVATQYWFGFRTRLNSAYSAGYVFLIGNNTSNSTFTSLLTEAQLAAAGASAVGVEHYIEIFMDRTALTFQVYCDGLLINSGALASASLAAGAGFMQWGPNATSGLGTTGSRGYRDFYFLDVDSTYTGRLGPIRAKAATLTAASGSEWTPNGAADLLTSLNTAIGAGSMTPNILSPLDKQALTLSLSTTITDAGSKILGVSPGLSYGALNGSVPNVGAGFKDNTNPLVAAGIFTSPIGGGLYNQKLPLVLTGPNAKKWTVAELLQSQYVLTPQ